ncbi:MAG: hypothetical protein ACLQGP_10480 [Isosphaeraceae bacterium]
MLFRQMLLAMDDQLFRSVLRFDRRDAVRYNDGAESGWEACPWGAIETVGGTVKEELIVCTVAILLVMGHIGNAFVVATALPMAILFSFASISSGRGPSSIMSVPRRRCGSSSRR